MDLFQKLNWTHYAASHFKMYPNSVLFYSVFSSATDTKANSMALSKVNHKKFLKEYALE